jgi:DNA primase
LEKALKARNRSAISEFEERSAFKHHFAPSALKSFAGRVPGALPQAVTFRAFGASSVRAVGASNERGTSCDDVRHRVFFPLIEFRSEPIKVNSK